MELNSAAGLEVFNNKLLYICSGLRQTPIGGPFYVHRAISPGMIKLNLNNIIA